MLALDASPHQWEISVPLADDRDSEARALFSVLGRAHGLQRVGETDFDELDDSIATLTGASHVPKPQQLQVLAKVARESSTEGNLRPDVDLNGWADSLVHPTLVASERGEARESLLRILRDSTPGEDPLGRENIEDLLDPPPDVAHLLSALHLDIFDTMFTLLPDCGATPKTIEGYRALSVSTLSLTRKRFSAFESIVDPCAVARLLAPGVVLQAHELRPTAAESRPRDPPSRRRLGGDLGRGRRLEPRLRATGRDEDPPRLPLRVAEGGRRRGAVQARRVHLRSRLLRRRTR